MIAENNFGSALGGGFATSEAPRASSDAAQVFRSLITTCTPFGDVHRRKSAVHMVAVSCVVAPELYQGLSMAELAAKIGVTPREMGRQVKGVRAAMAQRAAREVFSSRDRVR